MCALLHLYVLLGANQIKRRKWKYHMYNQIEFAYNMDLVKEWIWLYSLHQLE